LLVAALAYTLVFVFAGFGNVQDPLYWLYKYEHLEGGWMAVGTLLTGGVVVRLFGARLLALRLVGWLCTVTAIALPYCAFLNKEQRRDNLHWLALTYILMGYGAFQEFSSGTLSVLLLSALWVTQSPVVLGLAIAARFPNILALLVLIPLWKKQALWKIPLAALTAGIVYLLGYCFVTPAPMDAAMTSHDLLDMLTKLWTNSGKLILYAFLAVGVMAFREKKYAGWIVGALIALVVVYTTKLHQWYNTDLTYLISALVLVIAIARKQYMGAAILIVATLGTDTAWLKLFPAVLCLLPIALSQYETLTEKRYWAVVLAILSVVTAYRMTTNSIGNKDLTKVNTIASVAPYQGIAIRSSEQQRLLQYKADVDSLSNIQYPISNILAVGQENHLLRAVTNCEAARFNEFWSNIYDSVYTAKYTPIIAAEHPTVFCTYSPQFKTKPEYKDQDSRFEHMLLESGYRAIDRSKYKYMIYVYDQEVQ